MSEITILAAVRPEAAETYQDYLTGQNTFAPHIVTSLDEARDLLADPDRRTDVFLIDNNLGGVFETIREVRKSYSRLLIVLLDEGADLSMPGRADDVSTDPFSNDDLSKRIKRLVQERQTETLRADSLPPIRSVAKQLRQASSSSGKVDATVQAIRDLGYDFVAYYRLESGALNLMTSSGPSAITSVAPQKQNETSLAGWVAQNGQMRIVGPEDDPNYVLIKRGRLGAGVCVPVGATTRYGVVLACRELPGSISQENAMVLELVCGQLASALAKEKL